MTLSCQGQESAAHSCLVHAPRQAAAVSHQSMVGVHFLTPLVCCCACGILLFEAPLAELGLAELSLVELSLADLSPAELSLLKLMIEPSLVELHGLDVTHTRNAQFACRCAAGGYLPLAPPVPAQGPAVDSQQVAVMSPLQRLCDLVQELHYAAGCTGKLLHPGQRRHRQCDHA